MTVIIFQIYEVDTGALVGLQACDDDMAPVLSAGQAARVIGTSNGLTPAVESAVSGRMPVVQFGSTGTDHSANPPAVSGSPLITIPVNLSRAFVEVQNQSAAAIQIVRDDGAGNNVTSILLAPGGAGQQGGGWTSSTFKGRVRVYGAAGSQVTAYED